jgi:hypothetical protein
MNEILSPDQKLIQTQPLETEGAPPAKEEKNKIKKFLLMATGFVIAWMIVIYFVFGPLAFKFDINFPYGFPKFSGRLAPHWISWILSFFFVFYYVVGIIALVKTLAKKAAHFSLNTPIVIFVISCGIMLFFWMKTHDLGLEGSLGYFLIVTFYLLLFFSLIFYPTSFVYGLKIKLTSTKGSDDRKRARRLIIYGVLGFLFSCIVGLVLCSAIWCSATQCLSGMFGG